MPQPLTPPLGQVTEVVAALNAAGDVAAIGGSGLLASLCLVDRVGDWDVTTEAGTGAVEAVLRDTGITYRRETAGEGVHATRARFLLTPPGHEIDVLVGFALRQEHLIVPLPTRITRWWQGLPMADPAVWELAYRLLGRVERAALLERWLEANGQR